MEFINTIKFGEDGLVPAIAQHYKTGKVLMMAYMNKESLTKTVELGKAVFFSRSRGMLWLKGETSGNYLHIKSIKVDCDLDCLLLKVEPEGPSCHTGTESCFYRSVQGDIITEDKKEETSTEILDEVFCVIADRKKTPKDGSYTNYLFEKGIDKILKKVGEETAEVIIAAKNPGTDELRYEIADLMYHLMVLMCERGMSWDDIFGELGKRR